MRIYFPCPTGVPWARSPAKVLGFEEMVTLVRLRHDSFPKEFKQPWWKFCALPPDLLHFPCQYSLQYLDDPVSDKSTRSSNCYQKTSEIQDCTVANKRLGFKHVKFPNSHSIAISDFISLLSFSKLFIKTFTRSALTAEVGRVCQASFLCAKIATEQHTDSLSCDLFSMPATIIRLKKELCFHECCFKPFTNVGRNALTFQPYTQNGQLTHVNMSTLTHINAQLPVPSTWHTAPNTQFTSTSTQLSPYRLCQQSWLLFAQFLLTGLWYGDINCDST